MQYDTWNLRSEAAFETKIAPGLTWVPINTFGKSRYTCEEIKEIALKEPEEQRKLIGNLYESVLLLEFSNLTEDQKFKKKYKDDEGRTWEKGVNPDEEIKRKAGTCSFFAAWGNYFLSNLFEETGYIWILRDVGSGHIINYFKKDDYYYIFDYSTMLEAYKDKIPVEDGDFRTFSKSKIITGALFHTKDLENFFYFYKLYARMGKSDHLFSVIDSYCMHELCCVFHENGLIDVILRKDAKIKFFENYNKERFKIAFVD